MYIQYVPNTDFEVELIHIWANYAVAANTPLYPLYDDSARKSLKTFPAKKFISLSTNTDKIFIKKKK